MKKERMTERITRVVWFGTTGRPMDVIFVGEDGTVVVEEGTGVMVDETLGAD